MNEWMNIYIYMYIILNYNISYHIILYYILYYISYYISYYILYYNIIIYNYIILYYIILLVILYYIILYYIILYYIILYIINYVYTHTYACMYMSWQGLSQQLQGVASGRPQRYVVFQEIAGVQRGGVARNGAIAACVSWEQHCLLVWMESQYLHTCATSATYCVLIYIYIYMCIYIYMFIFHVYIRIYIYKHRNAHNMSNFQDIYSNIHVLRGGTGILFCDSKTAGTAKRWTSSVRPKNMQREISPNWRLICLIADLVSFRPLSLWESNERKCHIEVHS